MRSKPDFGVALFATALLFQNPTGAPARAAPISQADHSTVQQDANCSVFQWSVGKERVRMIRAEEGICFLSAVGGSFAGGGEWVRVRVEDGWWYLEGHSLQPLVWAEATCVRHLAGTPQKR